MFRLIASTIAASAIVLASLYYLQKPSLIGDGIADETESIQKLINDTGSLTLNRGSFRITRTIEVNLNKSGPFSITGNGTARVLMAGTGPAFRIIGTHTGTAGPETLKPEILDRQRMPTVVGIEIVGVHPEADGIEAVETMQLTIDRVLIRDCRHAIHLVKRNRNILITNCHLYKNSGIGIYYDHVNLHQSNIVGCHISYCRAGGIVSRGGDVRNVHVGTCDIEDCQDPKGPATANILLDSEGGDIGEVAITGCTIQHGSKSPDSANIRILGKGKSAKVGATREGHITITGNVFSDVRVNVDLQESRGITLTGNTFWMGYDHNLRIKNCEHMIIANNIFERNPLYDYGDSTSTKNLISIENCSDLSISGLHLHEIKEGEAALTMRNTNRCNINNVTILDSKCPALKLENVKDSRISGLLIRGRWVEKYPSLITEKCSGNLLSDSMLQAPSNIEKSFGTVQGVIEKE
jgi:hypothetical protein